ncbi:MAG: dipeptide/oligopeptide/nickel ABC transporter permease/ATP-binding protein [Nocardioides sp.]|uniref:dipeptide/oligopeptide/nickel ABC transporter permease/ATP-binding protein n=1 Tax=Nocardioides sp. TaxID=35761 RepID=UPI0039E22E92
MSEPVTETVADRSAGAMTGSATESGNELAGESRQAPRRPGLLKRLVRQKVPFIALLFVLFMVLVAIFGPFISPHDPSAQDLASAFQGPNGQHWLGTDQVGRDNLSRVIAGTRLSMIAMLEAISISILIGVPLGMSAGYIGGRWERLVGRANDIAFALPAILVVFGIVAVTGVSLSHAMIGLGLVFSTRYIALGQAMVKSARHEPYVEAAQVLGVRPFGVITRHITPSILRPLVVQTTVLLGAIILIEAELSYLGLAASASDPSWGRMLHDSQSYFAQQPFLPFPAGLAIMLLVIAINLAGDGVADAIIKRPDTGAVTRANKRKRPPVVVSERADRAPTDGPVPVLEVEDLVVAFPAEGGEETVVVDGVDLRVTPGETLGLAGESGSGKSLTAWAVVGLVPEPGRIVRGSVKVAGQQLIGRSDRELSDIRGRDVGMVFQDPTTALDPTMTVGRQVMEPLRRHLDMTRAQAKARAQDLLGLVGVPDPAARMGDYPHQFSGGMAQRVVIARALACNPKLLLADEPTTALDVTVQAQVLDLLIDLQDEFGMGIVLVTHDLGVVADMCDSVAIMYAGQIVERGTCAEVLKRPENPYTAALLASSPVNDAPTGQRLATIPGRVPPPWEWTTSCRFQDRCSYAVDACGAGSIALVGDDRAVRCVRAGELELVPEVRIS